MIHIVQQITRLHDENVEQYLSEISILYDDGNRGFTKRTGNIDLMFSRAMQQLNSQDVFCFSKNDRNREYHE